MMDEDQLANMLNNPHVAQQMNEMMNNDQFLDMMIQSNPMLRNNPNAREMVRSPLFRQMMTNPDALRSAARLQRMIRGNGGQSAFPMPGVTDTTPGAGNGNATSNSSAEGQPNLFDPAAWANIPGLAGLGGQSSPAGLFNPFGMPSGGAGLSPTTGTAPGSVGAQATPSTGSNGSATATTGQGQGGNPQGTSSPPPNPFANLFGAGTGTGAAPNAANNPFGMPAMSPEALQQMMQLLGMGGSAPPPQPADNRPPEERYAEQLRQLNDMGFYDFDRNVAALRRSGGSVQGAIEHLLSS